MMTKFRLLVVGRTRVSYNVLRKILPPQTYDVVAAYSSQEARKEVDYFPPALAFIHYNLRDKQSYALCKELAQKDITVIIVEEYPTRRSIIRAVRHGASAVLVEPFKANVILSRIHRVLVKSGRALPEPEEKPRLDIPIEINDPRARVEYMLKKVGKLLALPHAVAKVVRLCSLPNTSAAELLIPIESDSALTTSTFLLANSAAQGCVTRITNLKAAIARIGMKATTNMVLTQSVFKMFKQSSDTFGFDRGQYWIHCLGTACCARVLAEQWTDIHPEDAFLSAVLHDLGKVLLDEFLPVEYQQCVRTAQMSGIPLHLAELKLLQVDHTYVGRKIAAKWGLPESLCSTIANHHNHKLLRTESKSTSLKSENQRILTRMTCLANQLAKAFEFGHAGDLVVKKEAHALWADLDAFQTVGLSPSIFTIYSLRRKKYPELARRREFHSKLSQKMPWTQVWISKRCLLLLWRHTSCYVVASCCRPKSPVAIHRSLFLCLSTGTV